MVSILSYVVMLSLYRILKNSKSRLSSNTLKMQWMLFKAFVLSIVSYFILIPTSGLVLLALTHMESYASLVGCITFVIVSLHSIAEYFILIYFIEPYRRFWLKCFRKIFFVLVKFKKPTPVLMLSNLTSHTG